MQEYPDPDIYIVANIMTRFYKQS